MPTKSFHVTFYIAVFAPQQGNINKKESLKHLQVAAFTSKTFRAFFHSIISISVLMDLNNFSLSSKRLPPVYYTGTSYIHGIMV